MPAPCWQHLPVWLGPSLQTATQLTLAHALAASLVVGCRDDETGDRGCFPGARLAPVLVLVVGVFLPKTPQLGNLVGAAGTLVSAGGVVLLLLPLPLLLAAHLDSTLLLLLLLLFAVLPLCLVLAADPTLRAVSVVSNILLALAALVLRRRIANDEVETRSEHVHETGVGLLIMVGLCVAAAALAVLVAALVLPRTAQHAALVAAETAATVAADTVGRVRQRVFHLRPAAPSTPATAAAARRTSAANYKAVEQEMPAASAVAGRDAMPGAVASPDAAGRGLAATSNVASTTVADSVSARARASVATLLQDQVAAVTADDLIYDIDDDFVPAEDGDGSGEASGWDGGVSGSRGSIQRLGRHHLYEEQQQPVQQKTDDNKGGEEEENEGEEEEGGQDDPFEHARRSLYSEEAQRHRQSVAHAPMGAGLAFRPVYASLPNLHRTPTPNSTTPPSTPSGSITPTLFAREDAENGIGRDVQGDSDNLQHLQHLPPHPPAPPGPSGQPTSTPNAPPSAPLHEHMPLTKAADTTPLHLAMAAASQSSQQMALEEALRRPWSQPLAALVQQTVQRLQTCLVEAEALEELASGRSGSAFSQLTFLRFWGLHLREARELFHGIEGALLQVSAACAYAQANTFQSLLRPLGRCCWRRHARQALMPPIIDADGLVRHLEVLRKQVEHSVLAGFQAYWASFSSGSGRKVPAGELRALLSFGIVVRGLVMELPPLMHGAAEMVARVEQQRGQGAPLVPGPSLGDNLRAVAATVVQPLRSALAFWAALPRRLRQRELAATAWMLVLKTYAGCTLLLLLIFLIPNWESALQSGTGAWTYISMIVLIQPRVESGLVRLCLRLAATVAGSLLGLAISRIEPYALRTLLLVCAQFPALLFSDSKFRYAVLIYAVTLDLVLLEPTDDSPPLSFVLARIAAVAAGSGLGFTLTLLVGSTQVVVESRQAMAELLLQADEMLSGFVRSYLRFGGAGGGAEVEPAAGTAAAGRPRTLEELMEGQSVTTSLVEPSFLLLQLLDEQGVPWRRGPFTTPVFVLQLLEQAIPRLVRRLQILQLVARREAIFGGRFSASVHSTLLPDLAGLIEDVALSTGAMMSAAAAVLREGAANASRASAEHLIQLIRAARAARQRLMQGYLDARARLYRGFEPAAVESGDGGAARRLSQVGVPTDRPQPDDVVLFMGVLSVLGQVCDSLCKCAKIVARWDEFVGDQQQMEQQQVEGQSRGKGQGTAERGEGTVGKEVIEQETDVDEGVGEQHPGRVGHVSVRVTWV